MNEFLLWFSRTAFGKWWCEGNIHPDVVGERFCDLVLISIGIIFILTICFSKKVRETFFPK